jgi:hypothetical protein
MNADQIKALARECTTDFRAQRAIEAVLTRVLASIDVRAEVALWVLENWDKTIEAPGGRTLHVWITDNAAAYGGALQAATAAHVILLTTKGRLP